MSDEFSSFNDPALRAAVRRAWSDERAPYELRQRVLKLMPTQARAAGLRHRPEPLILRIRSAVYGLAAAAVVLLAVGLVFQDWIGGGRSTRQAPRAIALDGSSASALFYAHDNWAESKDHPLKAIKAETPQQAAKEIQKQLKFPVLALPPAGSWHFDGAVISQIGKTASAQLCFDADSKRFVSIFSLPSSFVSGSAPGCDYCQSNGKNSLAGFANSGGFYCVVGSSNDGSLSLDEVRTIRDQLRPSMGQTSAPLAVLAPR